MVCPVQALAAELAPEFDADNVMCGLSSLTAQLLASNVDGRHVYAEYGRVRQERGHSLKEHGPFDPVIMMAATNYLGVSAHPATITHDVLALHVTCHRTGVRTVFHSLHPKSGPNGMFRGATCTRHDGSIST